MRAAFIAILIAGVVVSVPVRAGLFDKFLGKGDTEAGAASLPKAEIAAGLREALRVGTERVVGQLGVEDGFNADEAVRIPLPKSLKPVRKALKAVGLSSMTDDLELRLNRAAEAAVPQAKTLFWSAIQEMTLDDVVAIYEGEDDAATRYFEAKMTPELTEAMRPIVDQNLAEVGALKAYDAAIAKYKDLPFVPDVKTNLSDHVLEKGLDGVFLYLAKEEAAIRADPLARTTDILKKVFSKN